MPIELLWWPESEFNPELFELFYDHMALTPDEEFPEPPNITEMKQKVNKKYLEKI